MKKGRLRLVSAIIIGGIIFYFGFVAFINYFIATEYAKSCFDIFYKDQLQHEMISIESFNKKYDIFELQSTGERLKYGFPKLGFTPDSVFKSSNSSEVKFVNADTAVVLNIRDPCLYMTQLHFFSPLFVRGM